MKLQLNETPVDTAQAKPVGMKLMLPPMSELAPQAEGFLETMVKDLVEGAAGPFVAAKETGEAILASPAIGLLPAADQEMHLQNAAEAAWKGAAFWGSMFVGGPIANLPLRTVVKMGLAGAASGATWEGIKGANPAEGKDFATWTRDVSTAATFGALTGGVLSTAGPKAAQLVAKTADASSDAVLKAANGVIQMIPGGPDRKSVV